MATPTIEVSGLFKTQSTGNGSSTAIPVTWYMFKRTDNTFEIAVSKVNTTTGVVTDFVEGVDYTVALTSTNPGPGTVTLTTAHTASEVVTIIPDLDEVQNIGLPTSGALDTNDIASMVNRNFLISKQLRVELNNAISVAQESTSSAFSVGPFVAADANKVVLLNATYDGFTTASVDELVSVSSFDLSTLTAETALTTSDYLVMYDVSASAQRKFLISNLPIYSLLDSYTELTSGQIDTAADFIPIIDASSGTMKKVKPENLGLGGELPRGDILQHLHTTKTDTESISYTAGSATNHTWTDLADITLNITPEKADSLLLIGGWVSLGVSTNVDIGLRICNGNSLTYSDFQGYVGHTDVHTEIPNAGSHMIQAPFFAVMEAGNTATRAIKIQASASGNCTLYTNRAGTDSDTAVYARGASHITVIEVAKGTQGSTLDYSKLFIKESKAQPVSITQDASDYNKLSFVSNLNVFPTAATSHNVVFGSIFNDSAVQYTIYKNGSNIYTADTPSNRNTSLATPLSGSAEFFVYEALSSATPVVYDIYSKRISSLSVDSAAIFQSDVTAPTTVSRVYGKHPRIFSWNFNTSATGSPFKQVVSTHVNTTASGSIDNTGSLDPALDVSITPTSSSSKLLCIGLINVGGSSGIKFASIRRDSTKTLVGDAASNRQQVSASFYLSNTTYMHHVPLFFTLDAGSTSATTIDILLTHDETTAQNIYLNRTNDDTDNVYYTRGVSQLTVIEVLPN